MKQARTLFAVVASTAFISTVAMASPPYGPEWGETGDAGSTINTAQITLGAGPLGFISGSLGGVLGFGEMNDFEDIFLINIVDPANFRITTDEDDGLNGAFANFNTMLWLFQPSGVADNALGFLGNNNHPETGSFQSLLTNMPDDGSPPLIAAGLYYIAITRFNNVPLSAGGEIFDLATMTEISGPDGPGGMMPFTSWSGDAENFKGSYRMAISGAEFADVPAPGVLPLIALGALGISRRRRR